MCHRVGCVLQLVCNFGITLAASSSLLDCDTVSAAGCSFFAVVAAFWLHPAVCLKVVPCRLCMQFVCGCGIMLAAACQRKEVHHLLATVGGGVLSAPPAMPHCQVGAVPRTIRLLLFVSLELTATPFVWLHEHRNEL